MTGGYAALRGAGWRMRKILFFSYGNCIYWSVFFEVFAFEVRADPFADLSAGGRQEIDLLKTVGTGGEDGFYLLEIFREISGDTDCPPWLQGADKLGGIGIVEETAFMVTFFGPWVGEINVEAIDGGIGDTLDDKPGGIGADYTDVSQIPAANTVNGKTVISACPFNPDEVGVGLRSCLV